MDSINNNDQTKCEQLMAMFVLTSGISHLALDNRYFKELIKELRPSFDIPSRHTIRRRLLDEAFNKVL